MVVAAVQFVAVILSGVVNLEVMLCLSVGKVLWAHTGLVFVPPRD
jgi:hypothetical protein